MSHHRPSPDQSPYYPLPQPPYQPQYAESMPTRAPPPMTISLPQFQPPPYSQQQSQTSLPSPFETPLRMPMSSTPLSSHHEGMVDYFSAWEGQHIQPVPDPHQHSLQHQPLLSQHPSSLPLPNHSPKEWQSQAPRSSRKAGRQPNSKATNSDSMSGTKTTRQQFTACGACRHRRVKCDLKDKQEQAEEAALLESNGRTGPLREQAKKVQCSNCLERGLNCVDEFAPIKAAKQLRRGKRITEIEQLYGRSATNAESIHGNTSTPSVKQPVPSVKSNTQRTHPIIPELTREFFESDFFRRFQVQRPVIDPGNFLERYLSQTNPHAEAMGTEGAILCHVLYAWAVSYGVDEYGRLDLPEGGREPLTGVNVTNACPGEVQREKDRSVRKEKMKSVVEVILKEIDDCGVMRKPTWDGVRVLLMILPLTEGISTPVERLVMYDAAISQVFMLCSHFSMGYDGLPSAVAAVNGGTEDDQGMTVVRVRVYWYAFVHEGITTGLKGGRLHFDEEDMDAMQDIIDNNALVRDSVSFRISTKFATAPINLALACRKINKALTGPKAKRRTAVNVDLVKQAWEALERCWEEFDELLKVGPNHKYILGEEVARFADGWKIFLFEAQNVIYNNLEARRQKLSDTGVQFTARITESTSPSTANSPEVTHADVVAIDHLLDIAKSKCEVKTRQIVDLVKMYVGTRFFEWDASLVRDGTYYAAMWLVKQGGSSEDVAVCIQALNELRWAHAKAWERSADLRKEWLEKHVTDDPHGENKKCDSVIVNLEELGEDTPTTEVLESQHEVPEQPNMPPVKTCDPDIGIDKSRSELQDNSEKLKRTHASHDYHIHQQPQLPHSSQIYSYPDSQHHLPQPLPNSYADQPHVDIIQPSSITSYSSQPSGISGPQYQAKSNHMSTADSTFASSHATLPINDTKVNVMDMPSNYHHVHMREGFFEGDSFHLSHGAHQTQIYEEVETRNDSSPSHHKFVGQGHGNIMMGEHGYRAYEEFDGQTGYMAVEGYPQSRQVHQVYDYHHEPSHLHPHIQDVQTQGTGHGEYNGYQHHTAELQGQFVLQYDGTHLFTPYSN
ncbi:hypothetical protein C364_00184 [Cryptococcus neoformans Bt63]|nr:hypothetical protein C364_00184 [Cryptococcus neoformans var. grubii Bt63]